MIDLELIESLKSEAKRNSKPTLESQVNITFPKDKSLALRKLFGENAGPLLRDFLLDCLTGQLEETYPNLQEELLSRRSSFGE